MVIISIDQALAQSEVDSKQIYIDISYDGNIPRKKYPIVDQESVENSGSNPSGKTASPSLKRQWL